MSKKRSMDLAVPPKADLDTRPFVDENGLSIPERTQWSNKAEFVLSCISLSVGLGNVWRFPYLAYANGGGAFLLPYLIVLFLCGKPMYFMEIAFGQYHQEGPVSIWKKVSPIGRGIGIAQIVIQAMTAMYYIIIMAWTMFYFWTTLIAACEGKPVPWGEEFCNSPLAHKPSCVGITGTGNLDADAELPIPVLHFVNETEPVLKVVSSAQQYYDRVILKKFDTENKIRKYNLGELGQINLHLLANLAGCWVIVFFALVKGISSAGKVVYITSSLPFIVLFILLGRGASLPNAVEGIKYFIVPQFDKLLSIQTWRNAAEQMFYSLSVAFGSLCMLGSYNKRKNNCYQDALIVSVADTVTSIVAGLAMFSVLGYLAGEMDVDVDKVAISGPGLAFVTFPEALTQMTVPHLWAILFFIMLFTLGLGSQIGTLETVLTALYDKWPSLRTKKPLVCGMACLACFIVGLPFVTQGGIDLFDIFDSYAGGFSVLFPAVFELICIMWIYGLKRFVDNLKEMLGKQGDVSIYWRSTWGFLAPVTLLFILIITFAEYTPLNHGDTLPVYADYVGWGLAMVSILQIPIWAIVAIYQAKGDTLAQKFHESLWPSEIMSTPAPSLPMMDITPNSSNESETITNDSYGAKIQGYNNNGFQSKE